MHMLYNSDSFTVVAIDIPDATTAAGSDPAETSRGGFEIVDKFAQKDIFIEGAMAETFQAGVEALMAEQAERGRHRRVHRPLHLADGAAARPALTGAARAGHRDLLPAGWHRRPAPGRRRQVRPGPVDIEKPSAAMTLPRRRFHGREVHGSRAGDQHGSGVGGADDA